VNAKAGYDEKSDDCRYPENDRVPAVYEQPSKSRGGVGSPENWNHTQVAHRHPKREKESQRIEDRIAPGFRTNRPASGVAHLLAS
jgi:hypothetical protein